MTTSDFSFYMPTKIMFGVDKRALLPGLIEANGWSRVGLVIDHGLRQQPVIQGLLESLSAKSIKSTVGWCEMSEPSYDYLEKIRRIFEGSDIQAVIGVGGGSALDTAKAMAVLMRNREPAITYRGFDKMTAPVLPVVALPTTAGTGSEVTPNASFIDTAERRKLGINGEAIRPRFAIIDPVLTLSCPIRASVSAGVDSLVHATEAYVARKTNSMARFFAREGFGKVFNHLPRVIAAPGDLAARTEVMHGAFLAGIALMNSGTGPAAAMSYPLGTLYGVPHGIGGAIFLPHVALHNGRQGYHDYADLYEVMAGAELNLSPAEKAERFVARMQDTWKVLGIEDDLSGLKIDTKAFVEQTLLLGGALEQNPTPFGQGEIETTLGRLNVMKS